MTVAHLIRTIQDQRTGRLIAGASVTLCSPGTDTPIGPTLYSDVDLTQQLPNPFTSSTGIVDVYLANPITVLLKTQYGDSIETIDNLPILPFVENILVSSTPLVITNSPGTDQFLKAIDSNNVEWADLSGTFPSADAVALGWFISQSFQLDTITRDAYGAMLTANVTWPDSLSGEFTADIVSTLFPGSVDAWHITRDTLAGTVTYSQPEVTRDAEGNIIDMPPVEVT